MELPLTGTILERHLSSMVREFMGGAEVAHVVLWGTRDEFGTNIRTICLTEEQAGLAVMKIHQGEDHGADFGFLPENLYIIVLDLDQTELVEFLVWVFRNKEHFDFSKFGVSAAGEGCGLVPFIFENGAFEYIDK